MKQMVLDVGTCLHWFVPHANGNAETKLARQILSFVSQRQIELVQPAAWATALVGELVRFGLADAGMAAEEILSMHVRTDNGPATLRRAVGLAERLNRPVLQTIYQACALQNEICLITADETYFRRATDFGNIQCLRDWRWKPGISEPAAQYIVHPSPIAALFCARRTYAAKQTAARFQPA